MSSPFASLTQSDPIPVPFDPPHTITVRKLSGREYERAQQAHALGVAAGDGRIWATRFKRLLENSIAERVEIERAIADPLTGFDRYALARTGLIAWSYPVSTKPIMAEEAVPARAKTPARPAVQAYDPIEDIDDDLIDFIAREVLRRTKPALFETVTEEAAERAQKELSAAAPVA